MDATIVSQGIGKENGCSYRKELEMITYESVARHKNLQVN